MLPRKNIDKNQSSRLFDPKNIQKLLAYVFGVVFIVVMLIIAIFIPEPKPFQYLVFRIVLSLAIAGVAAMIPGFLEVEISNYLRAGGALAVFIIVYSSNPVNLVTENPWVLEIRSLRGDLGDIVSAWEKIDETTVGCSTLQKEASNLGERFINIKDQKLGDKLGSKIEKYRYAQNAYIIASDVECNPTIAKEYARRSLQYGETALKLIEEVNTVPGSYGDKLRTWKDNDFVEDRIYFHNALGHALLHHRGVPNEAEEVIKIIREGDISNQYYETSNVDPERNELLEPILNHSLSNNLSPSSILPCLSTC